MENETAEMHIEAKGLIDMYEQGLLTHIELVGKLIDLSLTIEPKDYIDTLPEDLTSEMKALVESPPEKVEDVFIIKYPTFRHDVDIKKATGEYDKKIYDSIWKVHNYLWEN